MCIRILKEMINFELKYNHEVIVVMYWKLDYYCKAHHQLSNLLLKSIRLCPTTLESVPLGWNLSNCFGNCYLTCYSLGTPPKSAQLHWNLSNYVDIWPITLEHYFLDTWEKFTSPQVAVAQDDLLGLSHMRNWECCYQQGWTRIQQGWKRLQSWWDCFNQVGKLSDINVSNCIGICPTKYVGICPSTLRYYSRQSVQLRWNMSNYFGICPTTLEYYSRWTFPIALESVQLRWNLSDYFGICPIRLEYYLRLICPTVLKSVKLH